MSNLLYEEPEPASPRDVTEALARGDHHAAAQALVGATFYYPDWREVQMLCLRLLDDDDRELAAVAATCLGHLARIHRQLDVEVVRAALEEHRTDEIVGPHVSDALEDIALYISS